MKKKEEFYMKYMKKEMKIWVILAAIILSLPAVGESAEEGASQETEKPVVVEVHAPDARPVLSQAATEPVPVTEKPVPTEQTAAIGTDFPEPLPLLGATGTPPVDPVKYTLGPEDVVTIEVRRHPEFSGTYPINSEGKIQYKYVGDIFVNGLTKTELKDKLAKILSAYLVEPAVDVTITEYKSKVFYVIGEVGRPGKYYMWADEIPIREAVIQAGLPLLSASSSKSKLITPDQNGKPKSLAINLDTILYKGDLRKNLMMKPGDVLYVPATLVTKFMRKIAPVAQPIQATAGAENSFYRIGDERNRGIR